MKVDLSTSLACTLDQAVAHAMTPRLMRHVAWPLVSFMPLDAEDLQGTWTPGTHWVRLRLFGLVPIGRQAIVISTPAVDGGFALRDAGHGTLIPVWDHLITIEPAGLGVRYRDQVDVRAGLLTPLFWAFAQLFYRYRQRRWRRLVASGFDYGSA